MQRIFGIIPLISELTLVFSLCLSPAMKIVWTAEGADPSFTDPQIKTLFDIPYAKPVDNKSARRQTFDLYLPLRTKFKPPLVVFIHGGFWTQSDDDYRVGPAIAD
ncbi:MAG: hypothetical protein ACE5HC_17265, partial [Candidatus Binatia bacterium]